MKRPRDPDPYVRQNGDVLEIGPPAADRIGRGAWLTFVVAPLVAMFVWFAIAILGPDDPTIAFVLSFGLTAGIACVPGLIGLGLIATAARRAESERITIDLGERLIERPGQEEEVFYEPDDVRVIRTEGLPGGWSLAIRDEDGTIEELVRHIPRTRGRLVARAADHLAEIFDVRARVSKRARNAPMLVPERSAKWAALCYLPIPLIAEAYTFWALATSPKQGLRFAAKQNLTQLALELMLGFLALGCIGTPAVAIGDTLPLGLRFGALICPLSILIGLRSGIRVVAAVRAYRGKLWVMPWIGFITRRWLPESLRKRPREKMPRAEKPKSPIVPAPKPRTGYSTRSGGPW